MITHHRHHRRDHRRRTTLLLLPLLLAALPALAGCGTQPYRVPVASAPSAPSAAPSAPSAATPSPISDPLCPGESRSPSASAPAAGEPGPGDGPPNYADNNGFMVPFPLHGRQRCAGLAQVQRITTALQPLLAQHDFVPADTAARLVGLGYAADKVVAVQNGPTGVSFTVDLLPICLEGTLDRASVQAQAHGSYPDNNSCTPRQGGH